MYRFAIETLFKWKNKKNLVGGMPEAVQSFPSKKISTLPKWPKMNVYHYTDDRYTLGVQ